MGGLISPRQQSLLALPRWQWLDEFLRLWFARPLEAADGCTPEELTGIAARIGIALPAVLAEWFELVGHRLEPVQDAPARPEMVRVQDGRVAVWTENQGVWTLLADAGVDPLCHSDSPDFEFTPAPLSETLRGMLLSGTIVGAWAGEGRGPLGEFAPSVAGGLIDDATEEDVARVLAAFPALEVPGNPFTNLSPHGDGVTLLREGMGLEWAAATVETIERIDALISLEPPGCLYQVRLVLPIEVARGVGMIRTNGAPDHEVIRFGETGLARPTMGSADQVEAMLEWETVQLDACVSALGEALPELARAAAVISWRPERVGRWRVVGSGGL